MPDDLDDVFPDAPIPPRRVSPHSFDDPAVKAKWSHMNDDLTDWLKETADWAECQAPMTCEIGQFAHRLVISGHRPYDGEAIQAFGMDWVWLENKQAWQRVT